jgi:hypothetical protein
MEGFDFLIPDPLSESNKNSFPPFPTSCEKIWSVPNEENLASLAAWRLGGSLERTAPKQDEGHPSIRIAKIPPTSRPKFGTSVAGPARWITDLVHSEARCAS